MTADCECVVIGAGVVGLAIAAELARSGKEVVILEKESTFGTASSARNSEVIHAGIYYDNGSLKAHHCVDGKQYLYEYCRQRHIAHRQCGKLIVACTEQQLSQLELIRNKALANGVDDLQHLSAQEAMAIEPQLQCLAALHSPSTGIIDSHALMVSLLGDAEHYGAVLATHSPVSGIARDSSANVYRLDVEGDSACNLSCDWLVNAAGHGACVLSAALASATRGKQEIAQQPEPMLAKGNYFRLMGSAPFGRLVYPVPESAGLGVHLTLDLAGQARFGPDVQWIDQEDYTVDARRSSDFYGAVRQYWPGLQDGALVPDYAGIRPKISLRGKTQSDFLIQPGSDIGLPNLVSLYGIESPGLTASLSIGRHVRQLFSQM